MTEKIEIIVRDSKYDIACKSEEKARLNYAAQKLNARILRIAKKMKNTNEETLLIMAALLAEDELIKKEDLLENDEGKISDDDLYDALAENMENIILRLEDSIEKIKGY
jgi:cell division protein ZapA (FtsZ GTPase activity inhibitor)